ncbi:MAG: sigma 54-interacting transcriptional regulator [Archangium sp.]
MTSDDTAPLPADGLTREEERTFDPSKLKYRLEVLSGSKLGTSLDVAGSLILGSGEDAGLRLEDATVSRRHASLEPSAQGVWVRDLGSKNGTFLAGSRVEGFVVRREATFALGTTLLRLAGTPSTESSPALTNFGEALGQSTAMRQVFDSLRTAAPTLSNVLLLGETGTGKDVLARAIHEASPRRHRPFVVVDCGALTGSLIESELFGHVRGAFTGAQTSRDGAFATARGGTVFLDEVGELPLELQPKLLRVLESRAVRRVGEDLERTVDVRVIAATHRDLRSSGFREDLYFRLAVVMVRVPPLRERLDDLPLLTHAMLAKLGRPDFELTPSLLARFRQHDWPGNVRELRNMVERAVSGSTELGADAAPIAGRVPYKQAKEQLVEDFTREYFTRLFEQSGRNVAEMARVAGIARTYAFEVIKKYGLK